MEKYIADCHIHSGFSFDSNEKIENIAMAAKEKNLSEIYMTEHFSVLEEDPSYGYFDYNGYSDAIKKASEKYGIKIKKGLEIGEGHRKKEDIDEFIKDKNFDFIIGSLHNLGSDTLRMTFRKHGYDAMYEMYFEELYKMVCTADFDVLGHLDLAQRYSWIEGVEKQYDISKYSDYIFETLKKIIDRGFGIEINTSFIKPDRNITLPRIEVIKMYKELGGEIITVGSDSHKFDRVGENIEKTYELLRECGFKYISSFKNRICEFKNL
ncbi:histidinol-phosphatase HisJ family protein [Peptacetobacter hominis]|uniref:Histidinol-phosphatase n=1 Tax=Peptacetobacter hominis TaxID=2743610 RepID=A0A544QXY8_9FIRM|nr:histidinol-phosphatase HisJ family protein [Peptacetobacter hominis]TQQ85518.1 histidinol-phosphatase HisJ family protein [Peptacetobacter hominis]